MRKHPILLAFIVIMVAVVALGVVVYLVSSWTGKSPSIAGNQVGVVLIEGILADSRDVLEQIKYFEEAEKIKAVVVRINSPAVVSCLPRRYTRPFAN